MAKNWDVMSLEIRVSKRFVIVIPKEVRERLNIKEGDELDLLVINDSVIIRKLKGSIKGFLKGREKERSTEYERIEEFIK